MKYLALAALIVIAVFLFHLGIREMFLGGIENIVRYSVNPSLDESYIIGGVLRIAFSGFPILIAWCVMRYSLTPLFRSNK